MIGISKKNQRRIYMFYFIVLLSALSWRLASAGSSVQILENVRIEERDADTEIVISLNAAKRPAASFVGANRCLILDFSQTKIGQSLVKKAYASRDLCLGYIVAPSQRPDDVRACLYIRPGCLATLRYQNSDVIVRISEKTALVVPNLIEPGFLLSPAEEKYAPTVISLHAAPLLPVIEELAKLAGIELELPGSLPSKISVELQAASPLDALKELSKICGLEFVRRGPVWFIESHVSEKPRIYAYSGDLLQ